MLSSISEDTSSCCAVGQEAPPSHGNFPSLMSRVVPDWLLGTIIKDNDRDQEGDEDISDETAVSTTSQQDQQEDDFPHSLEGTLFFRFGRTRWWKRRYVILNLVDGGSISCYRLKGDVKMDKNSNNSPTIPTEVLRNMYSKLHRHVSLAKVTNDMDATQLQLHLPAHMPWIVRDVENDPSSFVIEIPTADSMRRVFKEDPDQSSLSPPREVGPASPASPEIAGAPSFSEDFSSVMTDMLTTHEEEDEEGEDEDEEDDEARQNRAREDLHHAFDKARSRGKPLRIYFRCPRSGNEKDLWLRAFSRLEKLAFESRKRRTTLASLTRPANWSLGNSRVRSPTSGEFFREGRQLDGMEMPFVPPSSVLLAEEVETSSRKTKNSRKVAGEKEYRVLPQRAYPHRWMTRAELMEEMVLPSSTFHDLRLSSGTQPEIGNLQVEVLQCLGLPNKASECDAVVYTVAGSYAFCTDVIHSRNNPIWPRRARRACLFPLYHAYARLFVGVFNDNPKGDKSEFAGRVVLDVARLRPNSTYDVTLPLRLSAHVYARRPRGAIRLRFKLMWYNERRALLSYLPKKIRIPRNVKPNHDVTVLCGDAKAFRNVAMTVHGIHMPGKFSLRQLRGTLREINFTRKMIMGTVRKNIREIRHWNNPAMSAFVFLAWMHCVYANSFSLVPAYVVVFFLLIMTRNYARYAIDTPSQRGFLPPTWEELFAALVHNGDESLIEPMDLTFSRRAELPLSSERSHSISPSRSSSGDHDFMADDDEDCVADLHVSTHKPMGKPLFQMFGFMAEGSKNKDHLEFPFADSQLYPKFTVRESVAREPRLKRKDTPENRSHASDSLCHGSERKAPKASQASPVGLVISHDPNNDDTYRGLGEEDELEDDEMYSSADYTQPKIPLVVGPNNENAHAPIIRNCSSADFEGSDGGAQPLFAYPDQDVDFKAPNTGKKLTDDLAEIRENVHKVTFHLFNTRTYAVKHPNACYFGQARRPEKRRRADVGRDLDRLLNVGQYSHSNPVVSRVGLYVEPIIEASHSFLCLFRALFNALTWRDPILSFWISFICVLLAVLLFVFPWRLFMFILGVAVVGPQNLVIRWLRERRCFRSKSEGDADTAKGVSGAEDTELPTDQPLFCSQGAGAEVSPREAHRIVVPYSPLMYQRFYDWPPEPQFAGVKAAPIVPLATNKHHGNHNSSAGLLKHRRIIHAEGSFDTCDQSASACNVPRVIHGKKKLA